MLSRHGPRIRSIRSRRCFSHRAVSLLGETAVDTLAGHDTLARHRGGHAIWVHLRVVRLNDLRHEGPVKTLLLSDGTVFVGKQKSLEVDDFLSQLRDLLGQGFILTAKDLHLGLEVGKPLLLALPTFESRHTRGGLVFFFSP